MTPGSSGASNTNYKKILFPLISSFQEVPLNQTDRCQLSSAEQTQLVEPLFWSGLACLRLDIGQIFACGTARIDQVSNDSWWNWNRDWNWTGSGLRNSFFILLSGKK